MTKDTGIQLNLSEYCWDTAESAASFVLRYICTLRKFIHQGLQSQQATDSILQSLVQQLVNAGYEKTTQQRLRDYLVFSIKEHATAQLTEVPQKPEVERWVKEELQVTSTFWMQCWRDSLLERSWRALERIEHDTPDRPIYSVFHASSVQPSAAAPMLSVELATTAGLKLTESQIVDLLSDAKVTFAQLLANEINETISGNSEKDVLQEIKALGLNRAFEGLKFSGY